MADARDMKVWDNHAEEQTVGNPNPHKVSEDYILRKTLKQLGIKIAVDLGCGGGLWRDLFAGFTYIGIDQSPNMIAHAKKRGLKDSESFLLMDTWTKIPLPDNSVDLVFTAAVLQHNKHEDKKVMLEEMKRILKPNGYYMCTENTFRTDNYMTTFRNLKSWNENLDDGYTFTESGWKNFLAPFGFERVFFSEPGEYLYRLNK
jgi:ubiquinone/menaquinone biosynthesis C-methylase UbiE